MKLDALTIAKLAICLVAAAFIVALLFLKVIPSEQAIPAFTGLVAALLGALGLGSMGRHIGAGLATRALPMAPVMTLETTSSDATKK